MKTETVRARMDAGLKHEVEDLFASLGLTSTTAIGLFYQQIKLRKGLPFDVAIPNAFTKKTFVLTDKGKGLVRAKNAEEMFKKLGI